MRTLIISDFRKGEFCDFESSISLWGEEGVALFIDLPEVENSTLTQCLDTINQKIYWLEENKSAIVETILNKVFSDIQEWTSEIVTREDFVKTLEPIELAISYKWSGDTMVYVGSGQDYFSGHCFCVYVNNKNEITGCGMEG